jgi:hypothetical protein
VWSDLAVFCGFQEALFGFGTANAGLQFIPHLKREMWEAVLVW